MTKIAFGDEFLSRSNTFDQFKRFKDGQQLTGNDPHSGRPSTSKNNDILAKICK